MALLNVAEGPFAGSCPAAKQSNSMTSLTRQQGERDNETCCLQRSGPDSLACFLGAGEGASHRSLHTLELGKAVHCVEHGGQF
jgi:hypothetical protein